MPCIPWPENFLGSKNLYIYIILHVHTKIIERKDVAELLFTPLDIENSPLHSCQFHASHGQDSKHHIGVVS